MLRSGILAVFVCSSALAAPSRTLTFEDRVRAQEAMERVYYAHQVGATEPFAVAVSRDVLVQKVRRSLKLSAALDAYWHTPITGEMLDRELARITRGTKMPGRLRELFDALGNDPFVIEESLVRATLADRLARDFFENDPSHRFGERWDDWWNATKDRLNDAGIVPVAQASAAMLPSVATSLPCATDNTWDSGNLGVPDSRYGHAAVWTGSVMIVWGGGRAGIAGLTSDYLDTGARYDPATDSWSPTSLIGAPSARQSPTAVWTGTEMIAWGGFGDSAAPMTGGRYNPVSDTWTPTSTAGAPFGRGGPAVWTGSVMIVWGGGNGGTTGGRYNPATDSWSATSNVGVPAPRTDYSVAWTGTEMIIWGGNLNNQTATNTGARYNPVTNTWLPTNEVGAPTPRFRHQAVWTGSRMLVWGGLPAPGGQYDPATDTWTANITTVGAPATRSYETLLWTGSEMLVWGGRTTVEVNSGGRYNPLTDAWTAMSASGVPSARFFHSSVWTGSLMIVWGGRDDTTPGGFAGFDTGGRYDPVSDTWTPTAASQAPASRYRHTAVWTGNEMIAWGGAATSTTTNTYFNSGGRYDPAIDAWTPTSSLGAPAARTLHTAVWTGNKMIVWGGFNGSANLGDGGRYDPITDSWSPTSSVNVPAPRAGHVAIWTGNRMIVWGGGDSPTGGRYDPATDAWTPTGTTGAPAIALGSAVWTGTRMIVWGGATDISYLNEGARYDPAADTWSPTSTVNAPVGRNRHSAVWAAGKMIVWGGVGLDDISGETTAVRTGGRYDPVTDTWLPTSLVNVPENRYWLTAVSTGSRMIVWGGTNDTTALRTGGRYDPVSDTWTQTPLAGGPFLRSQHTAVWTGDSMIVWGGRGNGSYFRSGGIYLAGASEDNDGDGASECQGDCDDTVAGLHTDFDHDGEGDACDLNDGLIFVLAGTRTQRAWQAESGYTSWNSYRGSLAVLRATGEYTQAPGSNSLAARDCGLLDVTLSDATIPGPGEAQFQLVSGVSGGVESGLGTDGAGVPRANAHPCP